MAEGQKAFRGRIRSSKRSAICLLTVALFFAFGGRGEAERQMRIVSLAPSTTEILFALGLDDEIVAVSSFCNYPPRALQKERAGSLNDLSLERIAVLKPDVIFCTGLVQTPSVERLKAAGYRVEVSDPRTVPELFSSIIEIGEVTGRSREAAALVASMSEELRLIPPPPAVRPKVFVEIWHNPIFTIGGDCLLDDMITRAGGENIMHDIKRQYVETGPEAVIARRPDRIILGYMSRGDAPAVLARRYGWGDLPAVREGRVFNDLDSDIMMRPSPRTVTGIRLIAERIHAK